MCFACHDPLSGKERCGLLLWIREPLCREFLVCSLSHQEASPGLLNSSKLHLAEKQKFRWIKRAREERHSLLINEFGLTLCFPHPARLRAHPPVYAPFFSDSHRVTEFYQSFTICERFYLSNFVLLFCCQCRCDDSSLSVWTSWPHGSCSNTSATWNT